MRISLLYYDMMLMQREVICSGKHTAIATVHYLHFDKLSLPLSCSFPRQIFTNIARYQSRKYEGRFRNGTNVTFPVLSWKARHVLSSKALLTRHVLVR
jgi:hypothetical protein